MEFLRHPLILPQHPGERKIAVTPLSSGRKNIVYILKHRMMQCLIIGKKTCLCNEAIKRQAQPCSGQIISPATGVLNGTR